MRCCAYRYAVTYCFLAFPPWEAAGCFFPLPAAGFLFTAFLLLLMLLLALASEATDRFLPFLVAAFVLAGLLMVPLLVLLLLLLLPLLVLPVVLELRIVLLPLPLLMLPLCLPASALHGSYPVSPGHLLQPHLPHRSLSEGPPPPRLVGGRQRKPR